MLFFFKDQVTDFLHYHPVKLLERQMFYTYVLQSERDAKFYTGFTKDLKQRPALLNNASH